MNALLPLVLMAASAGRPTGDAGPPVAPAPRPANQQVRRPIQSFDGEVIGVDDRSVTIRGFGARVSRIAAVRSSPTGQVAIYTGNPLHLWLPDRGVLLCQRVELAREWLDLTLANGDTQRLVRADQPPRRFPADELLAAGRTHPGESPGFSYRLADLRVGDEVAIDCREVEGVDTCRAICIRRRPGGRVPPAPGQKPTDVVVYDELANDHQAYEEFGVPLPTNEERQERYRKRYAEREARLAKEKAERAAPPPREAKP